MKNSVIAYRNVRLHWRHSLAAIISIATGFVSLVVFQGYMDDVNAMYLETFRSRMMYGDVMIEMKSEDKNIDALKKDISPELQSEIDSFIDGQNDKYLGRARFLRVQGTVSNGRTSAIIWGQGYDLEGGALIRGDAWSWNTLYGEPLQNTSVGDEIIVGQLLAQFLSCEPQTKEKIFNMTAGYKAEVRPFDCFRKDVQLTSTTVDGQLNAVDANLVGVVDAAYRDIDSKFIQMGLGQAQALLNTKNISYYAIKFTDETQIDPYIAEFNKWAGEKSFSVHALRWQNHSVGDLYLRTMDLLSIFRNFVVLVILCITGLSVFNTMYKVVKERTREIGTLRSIGFRNNNIRSLFFWESAFLSIIGVGIGIVFSVVLTYGINAAGIVYKAGILVEPIPFRVMINPKLYVASLLVLAVLACLTGLLTTQSALRKRIVDNINHA